ncbi:MAG: NAD(P)H-quinone oxidoreductase [Myxococcales bacterium]|nr:NAD(P)H-quinone oxidoreductase [Myxococcales bacterium]
MVEARAVKINGKGEVDVLSIGTLEVRDPGPGEVRVAIAAAGLNRADTLQRRGFYPAPPGVVADVPGLEFAGTVEAVGAGVTELSAGERVMAITGGGGMATHIIAHSRELIRVPEGMSLTDAAAVPEVFLTAYDALFLQAGFDMGRTALLHAVGSGIGTAALQLVAAVGGRSIGTSRTADKLARAQELGLSDGIEVTDKRFAERVAALTAGEGVDAILDTVGAAYLGDNIKSLKTGGTLVVIGLMGGATGELPLGALLSKRARVVGSVLRARPLEQKAELAQRFSQEVLPLFERGALRPVVGDVMKMDAIQSAHARMEKNESFGKIVMSW